MENFKAVVLKRTLSNIWEQKLLEQKIEYTFE